MAFKQLTNRIYSNPKKLFFIDALGAMLSAFLLGVVLVRFENIFGIPSTTLYFLATLPCVFAAYDFYCYLKIRNNIGKFLKGIAYANILYCFLSVGFAFYHYGVITQLGWSYILIEILIILILANLEIKVAKTTNLNF